ncbi:hypothetical protein Dimus_016364 [Dionaea muscipula]
MSMKMKGLLKGLRYISQIFEEEEEKEMQIGFPTDVKHVAHIGWDGPTTNAPSWMTEFKSPNGAEDGDTKENEEVKDSISRRSARDSPARDLPALPKASRRQPSIDSTGSDSPPLGSPSSKKSKELKQSRRRHHSAGSSSKESKDANGGGGSKSSRQKEVSSSTHDQHAEAAMPNIPKKSHRKKSKDGEGSVKSSSRSKAHASSARGGSGHGSEEGSSRSYTSETYQTSGLETLHEEEVKG